MKKTCFTLIVVMILFSTMVYADNYKWDLVNALLNNDFQKIETILRSNIATMPMSEKRYVMNLVLTYSRRETTARALDLLLGYQISPTSFDVYTAINRNHPDALVQLLVQHGARPNGEILLLAMEKQRFYLAKQCIEAGVDVNFRYPLTGNNADGMTPLLYAARWNNFELARLLVENGANLNVSAADGNTALTLAQAHGNAEMCGYLTEHGALESENSAAPQQSTGIIGVLDNRPMDFQRGVYRSPESNSSMRFTGNSESGAVSYVRTSNGGISNGVYRINGNVMTIIMDGHTFTYRMDANDSFSGNGERWARAEN